MQAIPEKPCVALLCTAMPSKMLAVLPGCVGLASGLRILGSRVAVSQVEVDGRALELPEDIEGILLLNIPSYMGGVNLWASGAARNAPGDEGAPQSFCDGTLEVLQQASCASVLPPFSVEVGWGVGNCLVPAFINACTSEEAGRCPTAF